MQIVFPSGTDHLDIQLYHIFIFSIQLIDSEGVN